MIDRPTPPPMDTYRDGGWFAERNGRTSFEDRLADWLNRRRTKRLLRQYGGIQTCPWCKQCAQSGEGRWHFKRWHRDQFLDVLTCSVCGGTSLWHFAIGMIFIGALDAPTPQWPDAPYYDVKRASLRQ